jgi:adenylate kinase family enzyme
MTSLFENSELKFGQSATKYLNQHKIRLKLEAALNTVVKAQPDDPFSELISLLEDHTLPAAPLLVGVVGGPCSGKSMNCQRLAQLYPDWTHVDISYLLEIERRRALEQGNASRLGELNEWLIPASLLLGVIKKELDEHIADGRHKFILDGFPISESHLTNWKQIWSSQVPVLKLVISIVCPEEILGSRFLRNNPYVSEVSPAFKRQLDLFDQVTLPALDGLQRGPSSNVVFVRLREIAGALPSTDVWIRFERAFAAVVHPRVMFVLGPPKSGKSSLCRFLADRYPGWMHLCAHTLELAERYRKTSTAVLIDTYLKQHKSVPAQVTLSLIKQEIHRALLANQAMHFLVEGFPTNLEMYRLWCARLPSLCTLGIVLLDPDMASHSLASFSLSPPAANYDLSTSLAEPSPSSDAKQALTEPNKARARGPPQSEAEKLSKKADRGHGADDELVRFAAGHGLLRRVPSGGRDLRAWAPALLNSDAAAGPQVLFVAGPEGLDLGPYCRQLQLHSGYVHVRMAQLLRAALDRELSDPDPEAAVDGNGDAKDGGFDSAPRVAALVRARVWEAASMGTLRVLVEGFPRHALDVEAWQMFARRSDRHIDLLGSVALTASADGLVQRALAEAEAAQLLPPALVPLQSMCRARLEQFNERTLPALSQLCDGDVCLLDAALPLTDSSGTLLLFEDIMVSMTAIVIRRATQAGCCGN